MSKRKHSSQRGVIAIALFDIARATDRQAAAYESLASTNRVIAGTHRAHLDLAREEFALKTGALESLLAKGDPVDAETAELKAMGAYVEVDQPGLIAEQAGLLNRYRMAANAVIREAAGAETYSLALAVQALEAVLNDDPAF